ncbi:MAG TPA: amino acid adenylation domain-containing protein, partial [Longimicrobium sp.]|nr:amino acid adenylation domain-containing protein [Longimicrobium sp.]
EALTPAHLAYVIYTSGSTGVPKGVAVHHRAVVNQLAWAQRTWALGAHEAVLQRISFSFDASVRELFWALTAGACLVLARPAGQNDPAELVETIAREGVGAVHMVPSLLRALLEEPGFGACAGLARVMCGGEVLPPAVARRFHERMPAATLFHMYGPTETTVAATGGSHRPEELDGRLPLGRPVANTRVYVLDERGEPVPVGVAGELCIGGAQVARGYLGRPELTAERFVADPFGGVAGARLYRTGDLARRLPDGRLDFLGRIDHQVKVRGFRVELGEIEARLAGHPAVREAVVLVREDAPGEQRLVAYVVGGEAATAEALRAHLAEALPEYMVPAAYVRLEQWPLTPNGKLDRAALLAPEGGAFAARAYQAPETDTEQALAEIWAEVLRVERVGRLDHFFELGGHSLLAVQVISRVRQVLEVEVALGELFTRPVLADFARELETAARSELPPIEPAPRDGRVPLSFAQQRLWFLEQLGGLGSTYHMRTRRRLRGELDRAALRRALDALVARHEALRTVFAQVDGVPEQRIAPAESGFHLVEHDLEGAADPQAELDRVALEEARAPLDLERGPLIRGRLARLAADDHVLLVTMHHIVSDDWSMGVLNRELSALYEAFRRGAPDPLPPLPVQYPDYAVWQRRWVDGLVLQEQAEYWTRTLGGAPELLELPTDHPRPALPDHAGAQVGMVLGGELTAGLKALSRRHGTTLFMTVMAGWAVMLGRLSGQDDVVVGSPTAGRGRREIEGLIGFFVNTLALRVDLSGSPTVAEVLARVKRRALEAQHHQDIPFEQVIELVAPARSLSHSPLVQATFHWQNAPRGSLELPGLTLARVQARDERGTAKQDLGLSLGEANGRIGGSVLYATALFRRETVERWVGYLRRVLEEMVADDGQRVERLGLIPADERARVLDEWNRTAVEYPSRSCIHELVEAQVERTPDAAAVVQENAALSYAELNRRANRLAHHLGGLGVGPDARVAICVERGLEMVVGMLGVLKAGGAYVPLDPSYPPERLRYMLQDSAPRVVLTQSSLIADGGLFDAVGAPVLALDAAEWSDAPGTNPARGGLDPSHGAYLIYTSGSTGQPKGVLVPHRGLCNFIHGDFPGFGVGPGDRVLQFSSFSFDACAFETFRTLTRGASLHLAGRGKVLSGDTLSQTAARHGITHAVLPPAVLDAMPAGEALPSIRTMVVAGDAVREPLVRRWAPDRWLINAYGPTEATVCASLGRCLADEPGDPTIGRPIWNARIYILDAAGEPVPTGVAGELFIGGAGVARGYLNRPELTAERFVADPFGGEPGARMYRTGDRVRWLADGRLDFVGRVDHQVKLRGYRVELGEIEARLTDHPAVREAVVLVREDTPGDRRLVAYVVADEAAGAEVLRAYLGETLPEYMVPAAYLRLDELPLTPNGKLDRKALPAPEGDAWARRAYEAPVGETEEMLAQVWSEVLGVERVGRHDDFFELGGHSLLAVQVISQLAVDIDLGELFTKPVLADFARELEKVGRAELPPIEPAPREGRAPLSFAQQRLWFLEQLGGLGSTYHVPVRLRLRGALDRGALLRALDGMVARHETLRTTFPTVDGVPEQRIAPAGESRFPLEEDDLGGEGEGALERLMARETGARFDLERGPLIRGRLVRVAADDHVLLVTMHHIVSDGWSMGVFTRELSALYAAYREGREAGLPELPVQYADFALWQRRWVEGEVLREQADYWRHTLAGAPELLELPADRPRPARMDHAGAQLGVVLDEALTAGLKALGRRHGTTLFMTLLAGWATVLGRLSGQDDVVVGTPTAGRGRREIDELIGFFINTLALRVDFSGAPTVGELLARVKQRALDGQHHQDIPFEQVVELVDPARSMAHAPVFQVMFTWQNAPRGGLSLPGLAVESVRARSTQVHAKFDLSLSLQEAGDRIVGAVTYATALFDRDTIERHVGYLRRVLEAMAAGEGLPVERLPLLPAGERARVVEEWNRTDAAYPAESCVHELFQAQAARTPDAPAVVGEGEALAYAELNARANRLARHLRSLGVGPDTRVAVCLERGPEMVAALLAVLKAGGAYVPLDPGHPAERLAYMLGDSAPAAVLTQRALRERVEGAGVPVLEVDAAAPAWADQPATDPERGALTPAHAAYVIYTSGSTGRPKGVVVPHRGVVNLLASIQDTVGMEPGDRLLAVTTYAFDISVLELFLPLLHGARTIVLPRERAADPAALAEALRAHAPTVMQATPATWRMLLDAGWEGAPGLRALCGGEALPAALATALRGRVGALWNVYGPTETTIWSTAHAVPGDAPGAAGGQVPVGRPLANTRVYLLDPAGEPVPVGVAGELCIGGAGVVRGYLGRPEQTAERFVADPFAAGPGARMYRTGDRARWLADGTIEFLGRTDFQVKVRGFRIEPGEIEARLREHPGVRDAVVLAREDVPGDVRLVAYLVGDADTEAVRAHLAAALPEYMVPAAYLWLDGLPLTPNGKLDRKALTAPGGGAYAARAYQAPATETEQALAEIWAEVLRVERVGRHDHFFELGGHSLLAVQVISRVRQVLSAQVSLGDLFTRPTLAGFARGLETAARAELPPIEPAPREGRVPLSFAQQRLWFLEQLGGLGSAYHIRKRLPLRGELDRAALGRALDAIVARHESLRTTFAQVGGVPEQRIAPADTGFHLVEHDLGGEADRRAALDRLAADEAEAPFDLERGPLVRGRLVRLAADHHVLLVTMHHIVSDGWSMEVFTRELNALHGAFSRGEPDPLPALPVQYADYAAWQRRWLAGEVLQEQAEYWTRTLAGAPELLELPTDHPRPAEMDHAGALLGVELGDELTAGLKALGRRHGTTLFMTLLAGWATVLGRLAGQDDVVIGTPTANRGRAEIEGLIGFFVNTLALRVDLSGAPAVAELLARVKERALDAQHHQDIPFEQVVERVDPARSLAHTPLFQVMFAWQNASAAGAAQAGPTPVPAVRPERTMAQFDLSLTLSERGGRVGGIIEYRTALFERETVERYAGYLRRVLEEMVADERRSVARLALLPPAERAQVVDGWNDTDLPCPDDRCVHELFERQAEETPRATALVFEGGELTYAQLNARANRLAHHLRGLGVGPDTRVAVCAERSPELVAALLAVLKAGGAYVPLDPAYPEERLRELMEDSAPVAVLAHGSLVGRFAGAGVPVIEVDAAAPAWAAGPETDPGRGALQPGHLAYVIYTSGSTGRPKGVMVSHRAVHRQLAAIQAGFGLRASDRFLQFASFAFDASVEEIFGALATGAALVLRTDAWLEGAQAFWSRCAESGVTVADLPTRFWQLLLDDPAPAIPPCLRLLAIGGEAVDPAALRAWFARGGYRPPLLNSYGPTETTVNATLREVSGDPATWRSIGRPVANTRAYLLDRAGEPVPVGVAGELFIGGGQVARGYLDRPALTAERFVPDPFSRDSGARLYRTGDLGRWLADGSIEYLGRNDFQVKIRGFRIELGEVEARLAEHPAVRDAVVLAREDVPGERRLVAYYTAQAPAEAEALRAHLAGRLPEHMLPAAFVRLDALPLTAGRKVDRRALPAPEGDAYATRGYEAPAGETERAVAAVWAEVLGVERVGRRDHFFELGGYSLLAVQVISRVRQALSVQVALGDLFTRPVLADFARELETAPRAELPPIEPAGREGRLPLSFAQQRLWFLEQMEELGSTYHISHRMRLRGEMDRDALVRTLDRIVARHEVLRTVFVEVEGVAEQRIAPAEAGGLHLVEHDLGGRPDAMAELRRLVAAEARAPFDLARGPLIRGRLVRLAADDHVLLLTMHHIISDGWSMGVFTRELGALYAAFHAGEPDPLPPLPIQYADYAVWQRRWVDGELLQAQADYWKATLAGAPELLELRTDHPRPARQDFAGASVGLEVGTGLTAGLKALSQRHGTTLFMTLLAAWSAVLGRLAGQDDVVIGTSAAGRGRQELEGLIGFFVNTLALRVDLSGSPSVGELLARVRRRALEAQHHQDIPFEQVVELVRPERSRAHSPLFQVMFSWQNTPREALELPGLGAGAPAAAAAAAASAETPPPPTVQASRTARYDLSLTLLEVDGRIAGGIEYATSLFERRTVERFLGYLHNVLEAMVRDDAAAVDELPMIAEAERRQVLGEWDDEVEISL